MSRVIQNREAKRSALGGHRDTTARRIHGRKGRVEPHDGIGVEKPHAVRTNKTTTGGTYLFQDCQFSRSPLWTCLTKSGTDDAESTDAFGNTILHDTHYLHRGHHDDRKVDHTRNIGNARISAKALKLPGSWVYGNDGAREPNGLEIVEDLRTNLPTLAVCPRYSDCSRLEEAFHRRRRRQLRSLGGLLREFERGLERKFNVENATLESTRHAESGLQKHVHHLAVLAQHIRVECADSFCPRKACQLLE